ncbi:MAG TPA: M23 family metallopeptidase [Bacteroidales bacterium]|nr:M23 family metallopeptidase [Bacteroidales bacterium]HRT89500.1 M23 family metallopeptidase [Bacteroidales bacterium]
MAKSEGKKRNWRDKYRFTIYNDTTFEEVWKIKLTRYNAFLLLSFIFLFIVGATVSLIAFTNLREFIPGYPDVQMRRNILISAIRLDSLERELELRDKYFANLNAVISGRQPLDVISPPDTSKRYKNIEFTSIPEAAELRAQIEKEEKYNLTFPRMNDPAGLTGLHFFPPVRGIVTSKFDLRRKHYGTDIVTKPRSVVMAALDGTVIFTGWTMETGYVIQIQHSSNLITIYKHNASLLRESGDFVRAGETISVVGDSGELYTSGPHLHFEIWYKGTPLDPEKHISF